MKSFLLVAGIFILLCTGCSKHDTGCTPIDPEAEEPQILAFAYKDSIHATKHSSGMYYEIINPGTGSTANLNSKIKISYIGTFLNGRTFARGLMKTKKHGS